MEDEFDYYISLAKIFDEGYPLIPHEQSSIASNLPSLGDDISEKCDPKPEEHAKNCVPSCEKSKVFE